MPLHRVFKILFLCFLAAFALGCGSGSDDNFSNFQSFQNNDAPVRLRFQTVPQRAAGAPFGTLAPPLGQAPSNCRMSSIV